MRTFIVSIYDLQYWRGWYQSYILFDHVLNSKPQRLENLSILQNSAITWPYTDHPTVRATVIPMFNLTLSS